MKLSLSALLTVALCGACHAAEPIECKGHQGSVVTVAFSPNGKLVASGGNDGTVRIWNASDGTELQRIQVPGREGKGISQVLFTPDGKSLVVCAVQQGISFWDPLTGTQSEKNIFVPNVALSVSFSSDSARLAVGDAQNILIFNFSSGKKTHDFRIDSSRQGLPRRVSLSPDGSLVAACSSVWHLKNDREFMFLQQPPVQVRCFSPDGKTLLGLQNYGIVSLFETMTWKHQRSIQAFENGVAHSAIYGSDGKTIAACGNSPDIKFFDATTGELTQTIKTKSDQIVDVCFSPDGEQLAAGSRNGSVLIYRIKN
jgi:WD40 repeat protein